MPNAATVKKDAQKYASRISVGISLRKVHSSATMLAAIAAAYCAFKELHIWDRRFSALVILLLGWEILFYGIQHWRHDQDAEAKYNGVADRVERSPEHVVSFEAELSTMGAPPEVGVPGMVARFANGLRWSTKPKPILALLVPPAFALVVLAGLAASAWLLAWLISSH